MELRKDRTDDEIKQRRRRIGIVFIVIGLLGMLATAIAQSQQTPAEPAATVSASEGN